MKTIETIREIIDALSEAEFKAISEAFYDYTDMDKAVSRKGYKRLMYHLKKADLTLADWWLWEDC